MFIVTIEAVTLLVCSNLTIILTTAAILLYYFFKSNKFDYWEKQGVDGPKPLPIVGNAWEQFVKPAYTIYKDHYAKYGPIFGFYEMSKPVLSVGEPEILRYILVKDSDVFINRRPNYSPSPYLSKFLPWLRDEKWKRVRSIMSPSFTGAKIKRMTETVHRCISSLLENVNKKVDQNEDIDVKELYGAYSMDVIALCAFATKTNAHKNPNDPFVTNAKLFVRFRIWRLLVFFLAPKFILKFINFNPQNSSMIDFFEKTIKAIIKERSDKNFKANDLLQLLLDAEKSDDLVSEMRDINSEQLSNENQEDIARNAKLLSSNDGNSKLSEEEVIAQSLLFFVAGYETTAALLSYTTYALAVNPEQQDLLYEEVMDHIENDEQITYDTVNKMKYLNAVISETLRMHSPVVVIDRDVSKDYRLPNSEIIIPKGGLVQIPIYEIHHDANNYPEPESFKPERFLPQNVYQIKPYTYLPFGSGPRNCIGMRFALMEAKLALCNVIFHYRIVKSENTDVPLKAVNIPFALLPFDKIIVKMEKR